MASACMRAAIPRTSRISMASATMRASTPSRKSLLLAKGLAAVARRGITVDEHHSPGNEHLGQRVDLPRSIAFESDATTGAYTNIIYATHQYSDAGETAPPDGMVPYRSLLWPGTCGRPKMSGLSDDFNPRHGQRQGRRYLARQSALPRTHHGPSERVALLVDDWSKRGRRRLDWLCRPPRRRNQTLLRARQFSASSFVPASCA